jgi:type II secretory pathway pseudopilin PulG
MKKNQKGFSLIEGLLIVIIVGLVGGIGWYVWNTNNQTNSSLKSANKVAESTTYTNKKARADIPESKSYPAAASEESEIQDATDAYFTKNSGQKSTGQYKDDTTFVSENRKFAIQYYCATYECSQAWLKKVDNKWIVLELGLELDSDTLDHLHNKYDWPLNFTK